MAIQLPIIRMPGTMRLADKCFAGRVTPKIEGGGYTAERGGGCRLERPVLSRDVVVRH